MKGLMSTYYKLSINVEIDSNKRSFISRSNQIVLDAAREADSILTSPCLVGCIVVVPRFTRRFFRNGRGNVINE